MNNEKFEINGYTAIAFIFFYFFPPSIVIDNLCTEIQGVKKHGVETVAFKSKKK